MLFSVTSAASDSVDLNDLRAFGIPCYQASFSTGSNRVDGTIEADEYALSNRSVFGNGLGLYSVGGAYGCPKESAHISSFEQIVQEVYVSFDEEYLYLSARLNSPIKQIFSPNTFTHFSSSYAVTVSLSLSPIAKMQNRLSRLEQTYYFSASDLSCCGVTGERVRSDSSGLHFVGKISSVSGFNESPLTTQKSEVLNGQWYRNHAALSSEKNTVFECSAVFICSVV